MRLCPELIKLYRILQQGQHLIPVHITAMEDQGGLNIGMKESSSQLHWVSIPLEASEVLSFPNPAFQTDTCNRGSGLSHRLIFTVTRPAGINHCHQAADQKQHVFNR